MWRRHELPAKLLAYATHARDTDEDSTERTQSGSLDRFLPSRAHTDHDFLITRNTIHDDRADDLHRSAHRQICRVSSSNDQRAICSSELLIGDELLRAPTRSRRQRKCCALLEGTPKERGCRMDTGCSTVRSLFRPISPKRCHILGGANGGGNRREDLTRHAAKEPRYRPVVEQGAGGNLV